MVRGIVVRAQTIGQGIRGSFSSIFGGNIRAYEEVCEQARSEAFARMVEHAQDKGADAVIAMRLRRHRIRPRRHRGAGLRHRRPPAAMRGERAASAAPPACRLLIDPAPHAAGRGTWPPTMFCSTPASPRCASTQWAEPTLSLGYFQPHLAARFFPDLAWLRRATGGEAIVHHHELTYSLVLPPGARVPAARGIRGCDRFHGLIREALAPLRRRRRAVRAPSDASATPSASCTTRRAT